MFFRCKKTPRWFRWLINIIVFIIALTVAALVYQKASAPAEAKLDSLAKCLSKNGAVLYGNDWCQVCSDQKNAFGKSFDAVNYVNCDFNSDLCEKMKITGYPTWYIGEEKQPAGFIPLQKLGRLAGCEYLAY